jgi:uncharacterized protein YdaU (DUF1376 family)
MPTPPWMPVYVGDYLKDTSHLTTTEHGAYFLLLMFAWCHNGFVPESRRQCRGIAKLSEEEWKNSAPVIMAFFEKTEKGYRQNRLSLELERAKSMINNRSFIGKLGAKKRWQRQCLDNAVGNGKTMQQSQSQSEPPSQSQSEKVKIVAPNRKKFVAPNYDEVLIYMQEKAVQNPQEEARAFIDHHQARGWIPAGQRTQMKDWKAAVRTWKRNQGRFSRGRQFEFKQDQLERELGESSKEFRRRTGLVDEPSGEDFPEEGDPGAKN